MPIYWFSIDQIDDAIAAAINGGSGGGDEGGAALRNGRPASSSFSSGGVFTLNNDDFVRRLIETVRREPALYDPNHEHYGNKHSSAQFRTTVWQRLAKELEYPGLGLSRMDWRDKTPEFRGPAFPATAVEADSGQVRARTEAEEDHERGESRWGGGQASIQGAGIPPLSPNFWLGEGSRFPSVPSLCKIQPCEAL